MLLIKFFHLVEISLDQIVVNYYAKTLRYEKYVSRADSHVYNSAPIRSNDDEQS